MEDFLPHVSTADHFENAKSYFLGYMVNRLLSGHLGRASEDDRDHYGKKRLDMAGALLGSLFHNLFRKMIKRARDYLGRQITMDKRNEDGPNLNLAFQESIIENGLRYALATGNWGENKLGEPAKNGVSQVLNRLTFASTLSHLRRLNTPLAKSGKLTKPRQLHNTHWGMVCPAETPEGQACGLVKNLSLMSFVTVGSSSDELIEILENEQVTRLLQINPEDIGDSTKVFVNGNWIGIHNNASQLVESLRDMRRSLRVPKEVSIVRDFLNKEIRFYTDAGRIQRPLFIVEENKIKLKSEHIQ